MHSSIIGKIDKAHRYAQEPNRVRFQEFKVAFRGDNDDHEVSFAKNRWRCSCRFFAGQGFCSHTLALEKILADMLPEGSESMPAHSFPPEDAGQAE